MGVHHAQGPDGAASPDEVEYLRSENLRLNQANVRLTDKVRVLEQAATKEWRQFAKDNLLRKLQLDNHHLWERNFDLMGQLAKARKETS